MRKFTDSQMEESVNAYMHALKTGKKSDLEHNCASDTLGWRPCDTGQNMDIALLYRIKPTPQPPKYRAWSASDVLIGAWIRRNVCLGEDSASAIVGRGDKGITAISYDQLIVLSFDECLKTCEHSTDGGLTWKPCGVLVEEAK
jgi:hypothetical protein